MADREKKQRILQMAKDGILDIEEAADLLEALENDAPLQTPPAAVPGDKPPYRYLRIVVDAQGDANQNGKAKVRVNIPLSIAKSGLQIAQRFIPEDAKRDLEKNNIPLNDISEILDHLDEFEDGEIVNVQAEDTENGAADVRIYLD